MNAHNEQQARKLLALGLDEFGHHTEAANVRKGIDLDDYKVGLWAIRAALDAHPAAAQEAVAWQRRYIGATRGDRPAEWHTITKAKFDETKTGKWANLYEVRELYAAPVAAAPVDAPSIESAHAMGAKGAPANDAERLAFEAWMRGHCWALCATWDGAGYRSDAEQGGCYCPNAARTRMLWAAWRDRLGDGWADVVIELMGDVQKLIDASPKGGSEARDAARLDWLDANGFTAYRQVDPIDGLSGHCVVVHETMTPRRGNVYDTIRGAIDAAMQAQAGDAEVQP